MEKTTIPVNWQISEPINVTKFRNEWLEIFTNSKKQLFLLLSSEIDEESEGNSNALPCTDYPDPKFWKSLVPQLYTEELKDSVRKLDCQHETSEYAYSDVRLLNPNRILPHIPSDHGLMTLTKKENELKQRWSDIKYKKMVTSRMKYFNAERLLLPKSRNINESQGTETDTVDPNEVVLSVTICRPSKYYTKYSLKRGGEKYLVLGSQKLTELRDVINCAADLQPVGDFSVNPKLYKSDNAKEVYKSGFFFINGVFYNDTRCKDSIDYSKVIRDWMLQKPDTQIKFGNCSTKLMHDTTFNDLEIQQGYVYLYMHQGDCEHCIFFDDIRLINSSDSKDRSSYPFCYSKKYVKGNKCMMCCEFAPKWVTKDHQRVHADPFLFCDNCFYSFNYSVEGQKIGDYQAHPYVNL